MELDELKGQLNQQLLSGFSNKPENKLAEMMKGKACSLLCKIKKSILFEITCCIIGIIGFVSISIIYHETAIRVYFGVFGIIFIPFIWVLWYLFKKIVAFENLVLPVKTNLKELIDLLSLFAKRYFQFNMALLPVCFFLAMALGYQQKEPIEGMEQMYLKLKGLTHFYSVIIIAYIVITMIALVYFTKWYIKKLYGKYIQQLQQLLSELKE